MEHWNESLPAVNIAFNIHNAQETKKLQKPQCSQEQHDESEGEMKPERKDNKPTRSQ